MGCERGSGDYDFVSFLKLVKNDRRLLRICGTVDP